MSNILLDILNLSITATYIAVAVIVLRFFIKKAPKWIMCVLWCFLGLRLIFPVSIESIFSLIPSNKTLPDNIMTAPNPQINSGIPIINDAFNPIFSESLAPEIGTSVNPMQVLMTVASYVWLAGIAAMLVYMAISFWRVKSRIRESVLVKDNVYECDNIQTPFILGIIKPKIYLPCGMPTADLEYVVAHENAHIKRLDHIWKPVGFLLLSVYWFNPILWVAYVLLCRDIELACDEKVLKKMGIENKKPYSTALLNCSVPRKMISACPLAFGENSVKTRIKSILSYKKPAFWVITVALAATAVAAVCLLTNPKPEDKAPELQEITSTESPENENLTPNHNNIKPFSSYDSILGLYADLVESVWEYNNTSNAKAEAYVSRAENATEKEWCRALFYATNNLRSKEADRKAAFKKTYGYAIHDLNKDGVDELILIKNDYTPLAVFTMYQNAPVMLVSFDLIKAGWIDENGRIHTDSNKNSVYFNMSTWEINGSRLSLIREVANRETVCPRYEIVEKGKGTRLISSREFDAIFEREFLFIGGGAQYTKANSGLKFIPLFAD